MAALYLSIAISASLSSAARQIVQKAEEEEGGSKGPRRPEKAGKGSKRFEKAQRESGNLKTNMIVSLIDLLLTTIKVIVFFHPKTNHFHRSVGMVIGLFRL